MATCSSLRLLLAGAVAIALAPLASATPPDPDGRSSTAADAAPLSPSERGELTRQLVSKWGYYVQRVYGVPVADWAERMVPSLVQADPANFRAALARDTYEGAMSELSGVGSRLPDEAVINQLAFGEGGGGTQALGALSSDLVFTPVAPCRILDTRLISSNGIAAGSSYSFNAVNTLSFLSQGGSNGSCGTFGVTASAVVANLTAVRPDADGFATAYAAETARPTASSINYSQGSITNNTVVVRIPNPPGQVDVTLYTFARSHYVMDIVGYFAPPVATALACVTGERSTATIAAGGTFNLGPPSCPAGYTSISTNCTVIGDDVRITSIGAIGCVARNFDSEPAELRASNNCCRVPGR